MPGRCLGTARVALCTRLQKLVERLESSITRIEATDAIPALPAVIWLGFDVGLAMLAFFRLALMPVLKKSLLPNFPHAPLGL